MARGLLNRYFPSVCFRQSLLFAIVFLTFGGNIALLRSDESNSPLYAPLVTENTSAILRVNLKNFDFAKMNMSLINMANQFFDAAISDKEKCKKNKIAFSLMAAGYAAPGLAFFDALREGEISEFYYITTPDTRETSPGYIAIPIGSKKKEDLTEIRKTLKNLRQYIPMAPPFVHHGFLFALILPHPMDPEDYKVFVRNQFAKIASIDKPLFETAFNEFPEAGIRFAFVNTPKIADQFEESVQDFNNQLNQNNADQEDALTLSDSFQKDLPPIVRPLRYSIIALDQSESKITAKLQFNQKSDAQTALESFNRLQETILSLSGKSDNPENAAEAKNLMTKFAAIILPQTEEKALVWQFDREFWESFQPLLIDYLKLAQKKQKESMDASSEEETPVPAESPEEN